VGLRVVEEQMHLEAGRYARLDHVEESAELLGAMARLTGADHRSGLRVEGGEQVGPPQGRREFLPWSP
jgi:hypothetical protein